MSTLTELMLATHFRRGKVADRYQMETHMAVCDIKVAHIDRAVGAMESAIRFLKEHRKSVLLYRDTAESADKVSNDIFDIARALNRETAEFISMTKELLGEAGTAVPSAPAARKIASPPAGSAS